MTNKPLVILGSGGFASEVLWLARSLALEVVAFSDLVERDDYLGVPVKAQSFFDPSLHRAAIAVGKPSLRKKIVEGMPPHTEWATLVHPSAQVGLNNSIGRGSVICANCVVTCNVELGAFSQLNLATTIGHDVKAGEYFTTAPGVHISGHCEIGDSVYFGTNSCSIEGKSIAGDITIGAGAVVTKSLNQSGTYIGIPASLLAR